MQTSVAFQVIQDLYRRDRNFCSSDYDACIDYLQKILPFAIYQYLSPQPMQGWVIPPKWDLLEGTISHQGTVIYEVDHPLKIVGLSAPFQGTVSREELRKHLHFDRRNPQSIPYHFRQHYRPWQRDWGFCVSQDFYDKLPEGNYEVSITTSESEGYLKVAEYTKAGDHPETFAFVAHLDHPGMANDDLAGVAVGVELFRRLAQQHTKFTYRLVIVQEIIGSVFYLPERRHDVMESLFLEMLGSRTELAFQESREGKSQLESCLLNALQSHTHRTGPFRSIVCNDENVWESYGIPMPSLSRYPYPEYHSDKDDPSIISQESLEESVQILLKMIKELDKSTLLRKKFQGVPALAHPSYDLYVDPGQPAFGSVAGKTVQSLRLVMDLLPMKPPAFFVESLAKEVELHPQEVLNYLRLWEQKGLIELV